MKALHMTVFQFQSQGKQKMLISLQVWRKIYRFGRFATNLHLADRFRRFALAADS
jgi:hypothetical protein